MGENKVTKHTVRKVKVIKKQSLSRGEYPMVVNVDGSNIDLTFVNARFVAKAINEKLEREAR